MEIVSVWHIQGAIVSVHLILLESCYCGCRRVLLYGRIYSRLRCVGQFAGLMLFFNNWNP